MNDDSMRTMLRRRLNETTAENWEDSVIDDLLNAAFPLVQKEVIKVDPTAFMYIDRAALVADQEWYELPSGFWYELRVKVKTSATATRYTQIKRGAYDADSGRNSNSDRVYDIQGSFITFMAIPDFSVDPGFEIHYVPTLNLKSVSDTSARGPRLHTALHPAVPLWAHLLAMGETHESPSDTAGVLKALLADIPEFYKRGGEAQQVRPDAGGPYYRTR